MLLLVHPNIFFWFMKQNFEKQKAFFRVGIYTL